MGTKDLSVTEYAELRGITRDAVIKALNRGHRTPGVTFYKKVGKTYVLTVEKKYIKNILAVSN